MCHSYYQGLRHSHTKHPSLFFNHISKWLFACADYLSLPDQFSLYLPFTQMLPFLIVLLRVPKRYVNIQLHMCEPIPAGMFCYGMEASHMTRCQGEAATQMQFQVASMSVVVCVKETSVARIKKKVFQQALSIKILVFNTFNNLQWLPGGHCVHQ